MSGGTAGEVTLRALQGEPLDDERIRSMVIATAHAIAERHGFRVLELRASADRITVKLNAGRLECIVFAAELRRLTTAWYTSKFHEATLWGEPIDEGEEWKRT